jgi:DNA-binding NarL/FixJ family response regulator
VLGTRRVCVVRASSIRSAVRRAPAVDVQTDADQSPPDRSPRPALTPREIDVLVYLARGLSKPEVAKTLGISAHTVNRHTTNLMAKARIHSRAELVRWAIRAKLVDPRAAMRYEAPHRRLSEGLTRSL